MAEDGDTEQGDVAQYRGKMNGMDDESTAGMTVMDAVGVPWLPREY